MEDTGSFNKTRLMTLKRLDDPASKDFWDYVEKSKQEWREQQPAWSRELQERETEQADQQRAATEHQRDSLICN